LDSAANNRQRFVRASIHGSFTGPDYAQAAWGQRPWIRRSALGHSARLVAGGARDSRRCGRSYSRRAL
jgi:hypothetical protein